MVKNQKGGTGHKKQGRKFVNQTDNKSFLRLKQEEGEEYAQASKILGNGMAHVTLLNGEKLLMHIRGRFRGGRGRRGNEVKNGTWLLVGLWTFASVREAGTSKLNECDLLEVYTDNDKLNLKKTVHSIDWSSFVANDSVHTFTPEDEAGFDFGNDTNTEEYNKLMEEFKAGKAGTTLTLDTDVTTVEEKEDWIDDI